MNDPKQIIEMKRTESGEGEIRYTRVTKLPGKGLLARIFGIAVGVAVFIALATFFIYVVLPVIALLILLFFLRRLYLSLRRK